jgi:hypothetical protein
LVISTTTFEDVLPFKRNKLIQEKNLCNNDLSSATITCALCIVNDFKQEKKNKTKGPLEMH